MVGATTPARRRRDQHVLRRANSPRWCPFDVPEVDELLELLPAAADHLRHVRQIEP